MRHHAMHRRAAGFTLVECATVCAMVGVLAAVAVPSLLGQQRRMARLDAMEALMRVQSAQEQHRALHGLYASDFSALRGVLPTSAQGHYTLALQTSADGYLATAQARGGQQNDRDCPALTLEVAGGFPNHGPSAQCWNR